MKKVFRKLCLFLIILFCCPYAMATVQGPEIVSCNGELYYLYNTYPLSSFYKSKKERPKFKETDTAHWRGYTGTWEIADGMLYLTNIDAWIEVDVGLVRANLKMLFRDQCIDGRVAATWFTGELVLPEGEAIETRLMQSPIYEQDTIFRIESGKVVGKEIVDNTKTADQRALNKEMFEAIKNGEITEVRSVIERGADPDAKNDVFNTISPSELLVDAVQEGNLEIVTSLLEDGGNVDTVCQNGKTILVLAIGTWKMKAWEQCMDNLAEKEGVSSQTESEQSASLEGYKDIIKLLIERGADVNKQDSSGDTALMDASRFWDEEIVSILIDSGADVHWRDAYGRTALMIAADRGYEEIVRLLIEKGARVDERRMSEHAKVDGQTALFMAAEDGHADVVESLIENGADVNIKSSEGRTALMVAIEQRNHNEENALGEGGKHYDFYDTTLRNYQRIITLLISEGVDVTVKDEGGDTALTLAVATMAPHTKLIGKLLEKGADIDLGNGAGETALCIASRYGQTEMVRFLIEKGADANTETFGGGTPLNFARVQCNEEMIALLERAGATK